MLRVQDFPSADRVSAVMGPGRLIWNIPMISGVVCWGLVRNFTAVGRLGALAESVGVFGC